MARYLVTYTTTYTVEAEDAREAEAVAEEMWLLGYGAASEDVAVEIIEGIKV
jgi:hypothetical protein